MPPAKLLPWADGPAVEADGRFDRVQGAVRVFLLDGSDGFVDLDERTRCTTFLKLPTGKTPLEGEEYGRVVLLRESGGRSEQMPLHTWTLAESREGLAVTVETTERDGEGRILWRPGRVESWEQEARRLRRLMVDVAARDGRRSERASDAVIQGVLGAGASAGAVMMDREGPVCGCGQPARYESGWCGNCALPLTGDELAEVSVRWIRTREAALRTSAGLVADPTKLNSLHVVLPRLLATIATAQYDGCALSRTLEEALSTIQKRGHEIDWLRQVVDALPRCAFRGCPSAALVCMSTGTLLCDAHVEVPESMPHLTWQDLPYAVALRAVLGFGA